MIADERPVLIVAEGAQMTIRQRCNKPAPLVVNGGYYVGCQLDKDHPVEEQHSATITWAG